jgi:hypothetical protein
MKRLEGYQVYQEDDLVIRWKRMGLSKKQGDYLYSQGKRLPKAKLELFPWIHTMARIYVKDGSVSALKFIRSAHPAGLGLKQAYDFLNSIRNSGHRWF